MSVGPFGWGERERERESDGGRRRRHLRRFRNGKEGGGGQMCLPPPGRTDRLYEWLVGLVGGGGALSLFAGRRAQPIAIGKQEIIY